MDRRKFLRTVALGGLSAAAGMAAEGWAIERHSYEVTRFNVAGSSGKLKIAFMSDFHRSRTTSRANIAAAVEVCNAEKPDVVLLGGDFISNDARLAADCAEAFRGLQAPRGVFYVLGNHDHWHGKRQIRAAMDHVGLVEITNRNTRLSDEVSLVGIDDVWTGEPDIEAAFRGADGRTRVVLTHNPKMFPQIRERGCVAIAGHTHGGQINIPFIPNPYLRSWPTYVEGWFHEAGSSMYVNRGIGTLTLPIRFRCRPEITILTV